MIYEIARLLILWRLLLV